MIIFDYITTNYITLLILATIIVMTIVNSNNNIKGTKMIHTMVFVSFIISIAEYFEVWVDTYNKSNLLLAQIRPHFINSNLAVIRSLCYEDSEKAVEMIDHFSTYLRENIKQIDDERLVPFDNEMERLIIICIWKNSVFRIGLR